MDNRPYVVRRKTSNKADWARSSRTSSYSEANAAPSRSTPSVTNVVEPSAGDKKLPFDDGSSDFATCPRPGEDSDDSGPLLDPQSLRPGAVAVRGVSSAPEDRSDDDFRPAGRRGGGGGGGSDELEYGSSMSAAIGDGGRSPLALAEPVAAYKVQDDDDVDDDSQDESSPAVEDEAAKAAAEAEKMEQIRRQILASAAEAVVVTVAPNDNEEDKSWLSSRRNRIIVVLLAILTAIAVAVGVAVPLSNQQNTSGGAPTPGPDTLALVTYSESQGTGGFAGAIYAETRQGVFFGNQTDSSSGSVGFINCAIKGCALNVTNCVSGRDYVAGCCMGTNCPMERKCGDVCPKPPDSCFLTDPQNQNCTKSECYTCKQVNGKDVYELSDLIFTVDCLQVGTAIRESNRQAYKWAIFCGPVVEGPFNQSEHLCVAARQGAEFTDDAGGIFTYDLPCRRIALAECQCGPAGMDTYGLPAPNETCSRNGTCPFRCDDTDISNGVTSICKKFPGNISWWEGQNAFNQSWFLEGLAKTNAQVEIYIKGLR